MHELPSMQKPNTENWYNYFILWLSYALKPSENHMMWMELVKIGSVDGLLLNKFPTVTWTICWLICQVFSRDINKIPITMLDVNETC